MFGVWWSLDASQVAGWFGHKKHRTIYLNKIVGQVGMHTLHTLHCILPSAFL